MVLIFQQGGWFDPIRARTCDPFAAISNRVDPGAVGHWSHEEEIETFRGDVDLSAAVTVVRDHEQRSTTVTCATRANGRDDRPPLELFVLGRNDGSVRRARAAPGTELDAVLPCGAGRLDREPAGAGEPGDRYTPTRNVIPCRRPRGQLGADDDAGRGPSRSSRARGTNGCWRRRDDVLSYTSEELDGELEVIGPVEVVLYATSSAKDTTCPASANRP